MTNIRIGTRGSQLALWQANEVSNRLREVGYRPEIITIKTAGDKRTDTSLASIGGKGLFVKELEEALTRGEIDIAVHSLKDVPSIIPDRFVLAGFLDRADARDAWVHIGGRLLADMPAGAVIGTSAPRRRAQLRAKFPQLRLEEMRGNVDTRINKLRAGLYDGAVLATAGLTRLGRVSEITSRFDVDDMTPAAGQGIVGIETRKDDDASRKAAAAINHAPTETAATIERGVLQKFGEMLDCYSAVAVHATCTTGNSAGRPGEEERPDGLSYTVRAFFGEIDGDRAIRVKRSGSSADAVVQQVFDELVDRGAMVLLNSAAGERR